MLRGLEQLRRFRLASIIVLWLSILPAVASAAPSEKVKKSDGLFTSQAIPHLRIEISPEGMDILRHYDFDMNDLMERTNVLAAVREGKTIYTNVSVHLKGHLGSFRPVDSKPALTLNFDKEAKGQKFHGLQKIHLNNSVQDPSYVSEQISRELFLSAGIPTPRAAHATAELNGRALGLFVLVEGWNKQFLKRHFKNPNGNLFDGGFSKDITYPLDATSGDDPDDRTMLDVLVGACQEPDPATRLADIKQVLDLDEFMNFFALEILTAHWDGYALNKNNFRVYHDPESNKLVFLPHGMDQMFGVWRMKPTSSITPQMKGIVAEAVIRTPQGRQRYMARMGHLITNVVDAARLCTRVDELSAKIQPALTNNNGELENQKQAAAQLRNRIITRAASVREQLPNANQPIHFDASGAYALYGWELRRDSGSPSFSRTRGGRELNVIASNTARYSYGSWRTMIRLGDGQYQLVGKVKLEGAEFAPAVTRPGATLRVSGERLSTMTTNATDWTTMTYDFSVSGVMDYEVVCEFRGSKGRAIFDTDSLRVLRKSYQPARERLGRGSN